MWRIPLTARDAERAALAALLTADERERAARFYLGRDRDRWTVARGALRAILARYANAAPQALAFGSGPHGKPSLAEPANDLRFNLAHSDALAICAVARGIEVGVDVEAIRPDAATEDVARRFFAPAEVVALAALPPALRTEAFFACWTRKEAYLKARGMGLTLGLDRFEVSLAPGVPAALVATHDDPVAAARWFLVSLDPGPGYAGALAMEGRAEVSYRQWSSFTSEDSVFGPRTRVRPHRPGAA